MKMVGETKKRKIESTSKQIGKLQHTGATKTKLEVPRESTHLVSIVTELATHRSSAGKGQMLSVTSAINLDMKLSFAITKTSSKTQMHAA